VSVLIGIIVLLLLAVVVLLVSGPLRRARRAPQGDAVSGGAPSPPVAEVTGTLEELEAAREAKYREIRDAELDYRTGKLSREDYEAIDADLRGEALLILNRIEAAGGAPPERTG
jgi:hypothetical protein